MIESILLTFIPLFVAIDPLGTLPYYMSIIRGHSPEEKKKLALQGVLTALIFGVAFTLTGRWVCALLGITPSDFQIAGGLLLLIFSIQELFGYSTNQPVGDPADDFLGIVPLGIPIIAGPATITTLLVLSDQHSFSIIILALSINMIITLVLYLFSEQILRKFGEATSRVTAKVFAIFLAAIGIMMIRKGLEAFFSSAR